MTKIHNKTKTTMFPLNPQANRIYNAVFNNVFIYLVNQQCSVYLNVPNSTNFVCNNAQTNTRATNNN